jgi:hypothetical protein
VRHPEGDEERERDRQPHQQRRTPVPETDE